MIESPEGPVRLPKQQVAEGQTHGYIGDVETYDPPKEGSSNVTPDVPTAERRVAAAKYALKRAEAELAAAERAQADAAKTVAKSTVADKERERTADKAG